MDADAGVERAAHEGLVARAGRRGRPRRQGLGHGQRRQHRRHHGQRAAAHGPHQGRRPPGHRHADPGARRHARRCCSTPAPTPSASAEWLVQFAQMGAVFARDRYGIAEPKVGLLSIGEEATKGNPLVKETHKLLADRRLDRLDRAQLRRQRRGPRPHDRRRPTSSSPTASPATWPSRRSRAACGPWSSAVLGAFDASDDAKAAAEVLMPAPAAALRPARPRERRRRHAARRRRRLHHQPRLVVGHGRRQRRPRRRARWSIGDVVGHAPGSDRVE